MLFHWFSCTSTGAARPLHLPSFEGEGLAHWGSTAELWMCESGLGVAVPDLCPRVGFGCSVSWIVLEHGLGGAGKLTPPGVVTAMLM